MQRGYVIVCYQESGDYLVYYQPDTTSVLYHISHGLYRRRAFNQQSGFDRGAYDNVCDILSDTNGQRRSSFEGGFTQQVWITAHGPRLMHRRVCPSAVHCDRRLAGRR